MSAEDKIRHKAQQKAHRKDSYAAAIEKIKMHGEISKHLMSIEDYAHAVDTILFSTHLKQKDSKNPLQNTGKLTDLFFRDLLEDKAKCMRDAMATKEVACYIGFTELTLEAEAGNCLQRGDSKQPPVITHPCGRKITPTEAKDIFGGETN